MAYIGNDFTIDYGNKLLTHKASGAQVFTGNVFYSWLQDTFDELNQMDNPVPISAQTPTAYTLINGWFMGYESFKWLQTAAVQSNGWDASTENDGVRILEMKPAGYVSAIAGDIGKLILGNSTGHSGVLLDYDNDLRKWWVRMTTTTETFDTVEAIGLPFGTGSGTTSTASNTGENLWSNIYTLGTLEAGTNVYVVQGGTKLAAWWPVGHIDVLTMVKESGALIDDGDLTIYGRQYTKTYDHFTIDVSPGGRNAVPVATQVDIDNTSASGLIADYKNIVIAQVHGELIYTDSDGGGVAGGWSKWQVVTGQTSNASGVVIDDNGLGSSGILTLGNTDGTFVDGEILLGGPAGSLSGQAHGSLSSSVIFEHEDLDNGNGPRPYDIHCNLGGSGVAAWYEYTKVITRRSAQFTFKQNNGVTLYDTPGEQYISAQSPYTPVKAAPLGTFAGGTFFGAQSVWIENFASADAKNFILTDSSGIGQTPPNTIAVEVSAVASGDSVSVFVLKNAGGDIDKNQYTGAAANNDSGDPDFVIQESIEADTPKIGYLRIINPTTGVEDLYTYSNWIGSTFTLSSPATLQRTYNASEYVYCPIIDGVVIGGQSSIDNTLVQSSNIPILIRVRQYGILPFQVESTVTSVGASVAAIRVEDTIVS